MSRFCGSDRPPDPGNRWLRTRGAGSSLLSILMWKGQASALVGPAAAAVVCVAMLVGVLAIPRRGSLAQPDCGRRSG